MTQAELQTPLSEIELAELFNACKLVLTDRGQNLLRRLAFERDQLRPKEVAKLKLPDDEDEPRHTWD